MVELKKDLPEIFEEFADQRRNSFLAIKKLKEQGVPVVGAFCTYLPKELPRAMGAAVVGLCSVSDETIPDAEKDLPRNLCPLIKSSYGFAKTDKCPFFYFSDLVVGETTCDGKKKMYEMLAEFKPVYVIELPNRQSEEGIAMYRREIIRFKEELERRFETTITEDADLSQADYIAKSVQTDCLMEVAAGTADAAILDLTLASAMIGEGTDYADLKMVDELNVEEYGVAFRKGSDVPDAVNTAFDELKADGTMQALADKYGLTLAD